MKDLQKKNKAEVSFACVTVALVANNLVAVSSLVKLEHEIMSPIFLSCRNQHSLANYGVIFFGGCISCHGNVVKETTKMCAVSNSNACSFRLLSDLGTSGAHDVICTGRRTFCQ